MHVYPGAAHGFTLVDTAEVTLTYVRNSLAAGRGR
jgi:hypothetical protein